jgi:hypothetical protein
MNAQDVIAEVEARLKGRKDLDPDVVKSVVITLLKTADPVDGVDSLDTQLYKIAMRRTDKK